MGNIVNRVFDSSGPEGKVRGTPQQIIEKYQILARDAQLSNDRVAEQNFLQHAEHYARMLSEAQREMARDQESRRDQQDGQNGGQGGSQNNGQNNGQSGGQNPRDRRDRDAAQAGGQAPDQTGGKGDAADVIDVSEGDSALVETPEERKSRKPVFRTEDSAGSASEPVASGDDTQPETGEKPAEAKPRRARGPRKPRKSAAAQADGDGNTPPASEQSSAAE
ncbi:hypothetical protein GCM10008024_35640 [Allgaiera indica]|nr:hypothetical protein GCM10008024_35640 [Allgaiera indica]